MKFDELIPVGTPKVPLSELVEFVRQAKLEELPKSFRYYGTGDFWNGQPTEHTPLTAPGRARMLLAEKDLLYRTSFPAHDGAVYIDEHYDQQVASNGFTQMRARDGVAISKYLVYALNSLRVWNYIRQNSAGILNVVQGGAFERTLIDLPSLEVQNQIVSILDAHSELAELQAERVRLLKLEKDVLLEKIFAPGEGFKFSLGERSFDTAKWDIYQLSDCFDWENPGDTLVHSSNYDPSFATPVLTANKTFVLGYTDETDGIYPSSPVDPVVIFDDFTTNCKWVDFPFKAKSGALKFFKPSDSSTFDFFFSYLALKMNPFKPSTHQRHLATVFAQRMRFPKIKDQQLISEYFREVDSRIKLEEERLQLLKTQSAVVLETIFKN